MDRAALHTIAALLTASLALGGCGGSNSGNDDDDTDAANASDVEVVSADRRVTIRIPIGSMPAATSVTVTPLALGQLGPEFAGLDTFVAYALGPDGLQFSNPVEVRLDLDTASLAGGNGLSGRLPRLLTSANGETEALGAQSFLASAGTGRLRGAGHLHHFSPLVLAADVGVLLSASVYGVLDVNEIVKVEARIDQSSQSTTEGLAEVRYHGSKVFDDPGRDDLDAFVAGRPIGSLVARPQQAVELTDSQDMSLCDAPGPSSYAVEFRVEPVSYALIRPIWCDTDVARSGDAPIEFDAGFANGLPLEGAFLVTPVGEILREVGESFELTVTESLPITEPAITGLDLTLFKQESRAGVLSAPTLGSPASTAGSDAVALELDVDLDYPFLDALTVDAPATGQPNTQNIRYQCLAAGTATIGLALSAFAQGASASVGRAYLSVTATCTEGQDPNAGDVDRPLQRLKKPESLSELFLQVFGADQSSASGENINVLVGGDNTYALVNLNTGSERVLNQTLGAHFGALALVNQVTGNDLLIGYGTSGLETSVWLADENRFGLTLGEAFSPLVNTTDLVHYGGRPDARGVVITRFGGNQVQSRQLTDDDSYFTGGNIFIDQFTLGGAGATGRVVSAFALDADGPALLVTQGVPGSAPGEIYYWQASAPTSLTAVGVAGDDPRRLRGLQLANGDWLFAVSNFGDATVSLGRIAGTAVPELLASLPTSNAPVGIDWALDEASGDALLLTTGFNDNSFTVHRIADGGTSTTSTKTPAPAACLSPGHGIFHEGPGGALSVVLSCNGSDTVSVVRLP